VTDVGTGAPTPPAEPTPCPECGATYSAEQLVAVVAELRGDVVGLRTELAPILGAFRTLMTIPKIAKQLQQR
jgi:hypothetical protein